MPKTSPAPPPSSAKDLRAGWTQVMIFHWIKQVKLYHAESDTVSSPERISDTEK
jgi:hypothetical protein